MLTIQSVTYSSNPMSISQAFLISVAISETLATWQDVAAKTWAQVEGVNWLKAKEKNFGPNALWQDAEALTWTGAKSFTWESVKDKNF